MRLRNTLFVKIYITIVASLVLAALLLGAAFAIFQGRQESNWSMRRDRFVEALFPPDLDQAALQRAAEGLARAFDADVTIFDADGGVLAQVGSPLTFPEQAPRRRWMGEGEERLVVVPLPGERVLAASNFMPFAPPRRNGVLFALIVALAVAMAAWPLARALTRRLEALRAGVERWGAGDLSARIAVKGRDEVAAVGESFNAAAERVEHLVQSQRMLLANASHELRSPLARLRMAVELGQDAPDAHRQEIERNLAELDELVGEILLTSKLDHEGPMGARERVDLLGVAAEEAASASVAVEGEAVIVQGDPRLLARAIRNLIQNAQRHGAPPITVTVNRIGDHAEIAVCDHGAAISPVDRTRLFEPFYRPAGHGEGAGGWGLGLALVSQIADRHGGTARYRAPAAGQPAAFVIELPVAE